MDEEKRKLLGTLMDIDEQLKEIPDNTLVLSTYVDVCGPCHHYEYQNNNPIKLKLIELKLDIISKLGKEG